MSNDQGESYRFTMAEEAKPPKKDKSTCILSISLLLVSLVAVAAVTALIVQYFMLPGQFGNLTVTCKPQDVVTQFPGYFRTPAEQAEVERRYVRNSTVPPTVSLENCTVNCQADGQPQRRKRDSDRLFSPRSQFEALIAGHVVVNKLSRTKRQEVEVRNSLGPVHHGCCTSAQSWVKPDTATNQDGKTVRVVQLDKFDKYQYFLTESCQSAPNCDICSCQQPLPNLESAIVYKDDSGADPINPYKHDVIELPGCCKCMNIKLV